MKIKNDIYIKIYTASYNQVSKQVGFRDWNIVFENIFWKNGHEIENQNLKNITDQIKKKEISE